MMKKEGLGRRLAVGAAALAAFNLAPINASARQSEKESQTIVPGGTSEAATNAAPAPFHTTPLTRRVLEMLFRDTTPGIARTQVTLGEGDDGYIASFHGRDSHGRRKLFELLLTINLQNHPDLMIRECDDSHRDEVREVPLCDQDDENSVTFSDYGADGTIDGIEYKHTTPDLLGNTDLDMEAGTATWNQAGAQRTYERELQAVTQASGGLGRDLM